MFEHVQRKKLKIAVDPFYLMFLPYFKIFKPLFIVLSPTENSCQIWSRKFLPKAT
jgi:hypothetical protein